MVSDSPVSNDSSFERYTVVTISNSETKNITSALQDPGASIVGSRSYASEMKDTDESQLKKSEVVDQMLAAMYQVVSSYISGPPITPLQKQPPPAKITFHLVRHAEGPHNLRSIPYAERVAMLDPGLTRYGHYQSVLLSERFHAMDKVTHILCSPMRRTVHTAMVGFKPAIQRGVQVVLLPDLREAGGGLCNAGSKLEYLLRDMLKIDESIRNDCIDTSQCDPGWEIGTEVAERAAQKQERLGLVKSMLYCLGKIAAEESDKDVEIVVVTHSRLILLLEGRYTKGDEQHTLYNAEYRSYRITREEKVAVSASAFALVETAESKTYVHTFPENTCENSTYG